MVKLETTCQAQISTHRSVMNIFSLGPTFLRRPLCFASRLSLVSSILMFITYARTAKKKMAHLRFRFMFVKRCHYHLARSWLFAKRGAMDKAIERRPDIVVLDLEDSVSHAHKAGVRADYAEALRSGAISIPTNRLFVRINNDDNDPTLLEDDISALVRPGLAGFVVPKVETAALVRRVDALVARAEANQSIRQGSIRLMLMAETPRALFQIYDIVRASSRTVALLVGSGDLAAVALCDDDSYAFNAFFGTAALAARAAGIEPIWGAYTWLDDHAGFESICRRMRRSGYAGSACLSLAQVAQANSIFAYNPDEVKWAQRVIGTGDSAALGTVRKSAQESREMIGPPHVAKAKRMLERHNVVEKTIHLNASSDRLLDPTCPRRTTEVRLGEVVSTASEVTITDAWKSAWESSFGRVPSPWNSANRSNGNLALPFHMLACMSLAFTVSDFSRQARVHLGLYDAFQWRNVVAGDTLRALLYSVDAEKKIGRDGESNVVVRSIHWLVNQYDDVVFQATKKTMFSDDKTLALVPPLPEKEAKPQPTLLKSADSPHEKFVVCQPMERLLPHVSQPALVAGQLVVHELTNVLGESQTRGLCRLMEITNPHHHDAVRFRSTDMLVPGPFVFSAAVGNVSSDMGEILYDEIKSCVHVNKVNMNDQLGTVSHVDSVKLLNGNDHFEEIVVQHLSVKNVDMTLLLEVGIPSVFFDGTLAKPSEFEKICRHYCPLLVHKIACLTKRRFVRVRPGLTRISLAAVQ